MTEMITPQPTRVNTNSDLSAAIQTAASRIAARHPHLASMADKAAAYAERDNGVLVLSPKLVHVRNAEGTTYCLSRDTQADGWLCNCPAFTYRPAVINGRHYCKHIMAHAILERAAEMEAAHA